MNYNLRHRNYGLDTGGINQTDTNDTNLNDIFIIEKQKFQSRNIRSWLKILSIILAIIFVLIYSIYSMLAIIYPEINMVLNSSCNNPIRNWNGKLGFLKLWPSYELRQHSIYNSHNYEGQDSHPKNKNLPYYGLRRNRRLDPTPGIHNIRSVASNTINNQLLPLIIFGTHHRTGTYLARKIFSVICAKMHWCCIFHVSRDSIESLFATIDAESTTLNLISHNQWIWMPKTVAMNRPYRFIHFYRDPYEKILSSMEYHMKGIERWTTKPQHYQYACSDPILSNLSSSRLPIESHERNGDGLALDNNVDQNIVWEYCKLSHLCQPCCRIEHEVITMDAMSHDHLENTNSNSSITTLQSPILSQQIRYKRNDPIIYETMCHYLGGITQSLQASLLNGTTYHRMGIESTLSYYENLRMAKLIAYTRHDRNTLHINLKSFTESYENTIKLILRHIGLNVFSSSTLSSSSLSLSISKIIKELKNFDVFQTKPTIYKYSMSSSYFHHISNCQKDERIMREYRLAFETNEKIQQVHYNRLSDSMISYVIDTIILFLFIDV